METFWVFSHLNGDSIKHYRQFESPTGPYYVTDYQAGGSEADHGKGTITGKLYRAQEHADNTMSHVLVREITDFDFKRISEKAIAKFITALTHYAGSEKTLTFNSKSAFNKFIKDNA